jgi:serine/threonine-protein kinase
MSMIDEAPSTPGNSQPDLSGRRLGDYAVLRRLGQGGMAIVYLAEQTSLRRQVALKVLNGDRAADETYVRRFHVEAQAAAGLVHPCIAQIYEVGCIDSMHYISQEYVPGQNLRQLLAKHGPPDTKLAVHIIRQTAAALQRASEQGIVHRDVKPDNILVTKDGQVKVADFGLARIMGDERGVNLTQVGMTLGTPLYMSPEQFEGKPLDPRSDIYSLGVTAYHLLAGHPPFRGDTALAVAVQHVKNAPERLENLRPDLPGALCRIVHKMLAKQPHERQQSASEVLRELRTVVIDGETTDVAATGGWSQDATIPELEPWEGTRRLDVLMKTSAMPVARRASWWAFAVALLAAFAAAAAAGWSMREPSLLDTPQTAVPRQESAEKQYLHALFLDDHDERERALLAVGNYFPSTKPNDANALFARRAKQELARLYLEHARYDEAKTIFDEFAALRGELDEEFRAFGIAGQCAVAFFQGNNPLAEQHLFALQDGLYEKLDRDMRRLISTMIFPELRASIADPRRKVLEEMMRTNGEPSD